MANAKVLREKIARKGIKPKNDAVHLVRVRTNRKKKETTENGSVFNSATGHYITLSNKTGRFIVVSQRKDGKYGSGITEKSLLNEVVIKANPSIKKNTALSAEKSVLAFMNNRNGKHLLK